MESNGHWTRRSLERALQGDPEPWDALFRRYQLPLLVWVRQWVGEEQAALDIVQDTFARAIRHADQLRDPARVGAWLFGIARQRCVDHFRRIHRSPIVHWETDSNTGEETETVLESRDPNPSPDQWLIRREEEERFLAAVERLPLPQRVAITLHWLEGFPLETIAAILEVPVGTVKSRLHHARQRLRRLLSVYEPSKTSAE